MDIGLCDNRLWVNPLWDNRLWDTRLSKTWSCRPTSGLSSRDLPKNRSGNRGPSTGAAPRSSIPKALQSSLIIKRIDTKLTSSDDSTLERPKARHNDSSAAFLNEAPPNSEGDSDP